MGIFSKEIDKVKTIRQQQVKEEEEAKELERFKKMSMEESDKLRHEDVNKWLKLSEMVYDEQHK